MKKFILLLILICPTSYSAELVLSYAKHVRPVFVKNCVECHSGNNDLPDWTVYETVLAYKSKIREKLDAKTMPAGNNSMFGMNEHEKIIVEKWMDQGAKP